MKRIIAILTLAAFTFAAVTAPTAKAEAQTVKLVTKSITSTDTTVFANIGSKVKSFQYTFTESSGTTSGKVYLEGTVNGTWIAVDSLTLSDVTTAQTKLFPVTSTNYLSYRFRNSAAITGAVRAAWLRRTDE